MSWTDFALARQLIAEERIGTAVRRAQSSEDAAFSAAAKHLSR